MLLLAVANGYAQENYWQQKTDFEIAVQLLDEQKAIEGNLNLTYHNNSPDTLNFIYFHVWPNAYKNDRTSFSKQLLTQNNTDFYFADDDKRGYISKLNFTSSNEALMWEYDSIHADIIKVYLKNSLPPYQKIVITTPFFVKLPFNFSRSGFSENTFQLTQWYPKPAMYDSKGWHPMPYLHLGEYYNNFGDYKVSITTGKNYKLAATGKLAESIQNSSLTTRVYMQNNVTDFAWFASPDYVAKSDTTIIGGKKIEMNIFILPGNEENWKNAFHFIKRSLEHKTELIGPYPFDVVTVVEKPKTTIAGGMEYPTITVIDKVRNEKELDYLINHEVGHNWFQASLASNERKYPWMDEGFNSYYDTKYIEKYHLAGSRNIPVISKKLPNNFIDLGLRSIIKAKADQPINTSSDDYYYLNYGLIAYEKTAQWLDLLRKKTGDDAFNKIMQEYYRQWKNKHPQPENFKKIADSISSTDLTSHFKLLNENGYLEIQKPRAIKPTLFFNLKETEKYNYISLMPVVGFNTYNSFMMGGAVHNYSLPMPSVRFFVAPMYSTGTKSLQGLARLGYKHFFAQNASVEVFSAYNEFAMKSYIDSAGVDHIFNFRKISPGIRYVFPQNFKQPFARQSLQYKLFNIREEGFLFVKDSNTQVYNLTFPTNNYSIHQLKWSYNNERKLYPHQASIQAEINNSFIKTGFTGSYFFNYANGGGLEGRVYAGKFIYTATANAAKKFETSRFHLNMSAPSGSKDYTYENYFMGRNEFEGFYSRQRMEKEGNFKVNSDLFSNEIGTTDNWLVAFNFATTLPNNIYPFNEFIPLKIFADAGTNDILINRNNSNNRIVFDAGLQLSLLKNLIHINLPLVYSKVYKDYYNSVYGKNNWKQRISFSINLQNMQLGKFFPVSNL